MNKLKKLAEELMGKNDQISEKLGELVEATNNFTYSKEHYETVMRLCKEGLKIMEDTKTTSSNIREFVDDYFMPLNSAARQMKQKLIDHIDEQGPEALDGTEDTLLDIMNMYKKKFAKKQAELKSFDQYHQTYMFYTKQVDPSLLEIEIKL